MIQSPPWEEKSLSSTHVSSYLIFLIISSSKGSRALTYVVNWVFLFFTFLLKLRQMSRSRCKWVWCKCLQVAQVPCHACIFWHQPGLSHVDTYVPSWGPHSRWIRTDSLLTSLYWFLKCPIFFFFPSWYLHRRQNSHVPGKTYCIIYKSFLRSTLAIFSLFQTQQ